jgi:hypothetical protein
MVFHLQSVWRCFRSTRLESGHNRKPIMVNTNVRRGARSLFIYIWFRFCKLHWEKGLVSVLMKLFKKFKVSSNGPSTEWVGYETLTFYTSFAIVETTPFFQCWERLGQRRFYVCLEPYRVQRQRSTRPLRVRPEAPP